MQKVSSKRQITLTVEQCKLAQIKPGDIVETIVEREGMISIRKSLTHAKPKR